MGIFENPNTWGSPAWIFIYCIVNTYPENPSLTEKLHYKNFFDSLQFILPCKICRKHYLEWLNINPIYKYLKNKQSLKSWLFLLHNNVNLRLNKKCFQDLETSDLIMQKYIQKCMKKK